MPNHLHPSIEFARSQPLWIDNGTVLPVAPVLCGGAAVDLLIVGAGFTGLWAALECKLRYPNKSVMVIDAGRIAQQASGRNGGFCSASLTHGLDNGIARFGDEFAEIEKFARRNFDEIRSRVREFDIDCDWHEPGTLSVATEPHLVSGLREEAELARQFGYAAELLDGPQVRAQLDGANFLSGLWTHDGEALVDPYRLAEGLASAATRLGVVIHERTALLDLTERGAGVAARTESGTVTAGSVILATNAFKSPVKAINRLVAPVYDYVLATEPLNAAQMDSIGWQNRQGVSDRTNQFHYYRMTKDHRIVWGGFDAVYYWGGRIDPSLDQSDATHSLLAEQFFDTFPQLEGLNFSHRWGGVIDTCSRFSVCFGRSHHHKVVYAVGYTGLGVGASRFGATVCLDMLYEPGADSLRLKLVNSAPLPFPPEPFRYVGITATRKSLARADNNAGKRNLWLRALDAVGLGFDS